MTNSLQVKMVCYAWTEKEMGYLLEVIKVKKNILDRKQTYKEKKANVIVLNQRFQAWQLLLHTIYGSTCKWQCNLLK